MYDKPAFPENKRAKPNIMAKVMTNPPAVEYLCCWVVKYYLTTQPFDYSTTPREVFMRKEIFPVLILMVVLFHGSAGLLYSAESQGQALAGLGFCLGPEDILEISVWKDEALIKQVVVRPDGKISFPLIGDVVAQGRTVEELRQAVEDKIKAFVPDAPVTVMVVQVGSPKVYVVGKVARPGVYIMGQTLRVMQVLAMAGGMTPFADKDDILIIRKEDGKQKIFKFDYSKVADGKDLEQNICLKPGDTVVVP